MLEPKLLIVSAMKTEQEPLLSYFNLKNPKTKLHGIYPLYEILLEKKKLYFVQSYVGDVNASIAGHSAIQQIDPDFVIKFGAVGGSFPESKAGDVVVPMGFFHRTGWITKDKQTHMPSSDASVWESVFGEKDYQIQESRNNLGGLPYYFPVPGKLQGVCKKALGELKIDFVEAHVGGGNMWMFDRALLENVAEEMIPKESANRRFVSDMESYALAHACHVTKRPFLGCYVVASNDYKNEEYDPNLVASQMEELVPYLVEVIKGLAKGN